MELAFLSPSPMELAVIAVIALLVLGPSRLPEAARSLGKGMREMRDSFQSAGDDDDDHDGADFDEDADLYAPGDEIDEDPDDDDDGSVGAEPTVKTAPASGGTTA